MQCANGEYALVLDDFVLYLTVVQRKICSYCIGVNIWYFLSLKNIVDGRKCEFWFQNKSDSDKLFLS